MLAPFEPVPLAAGLLAILLLIFAPRLGSLFRRPWLTIVGAATISAALSWLYVVVYLRGGPRIIDATTYYLQGRTLASGELTFPLEEPAASVMGRFLLRVDGPEGARASGIFPPGYPAWLALGFKLGAPLAMGPVLAFALVLATYGLARVVLRDRDRDGSIAIVAAMLSSVCAALRYHTADTMSHGLAALCFTLALTALYAALDAETRGKTLGLALVSGFFLGWLAATRPPSALALGLLLSALVLMSRGRSRGQRASLIAALLLGAVPFVTLLVVQQHAATGAWLGSSQRAYYAVSDGPPGCFAYGFGEGIGCVGEHEAFVRDNLAHGFGAFEALMTTLRRLRMHAADAGNAEPLILLVIGGAVAHRKTPRVGALAAGVGLLVLAYLPFYFDGNYPGGGARMLADALPLEHVLLALGAAAVAERFERRGARATWGVVALSLLGFWLRGSFSHAALRERDGGFPMATDAVLDAAKAQRALVFFDTDHGFNLAFDPAPTAALKAFRYRGDGIDGLVAAAHPNAALFRYRYDLAAEGAPSNGHLEPYTPVTSRVVEAESLWPPVAQERGYALVEYASRPCFSGRSLNLVGTGSGALVRLALPVDLVRGQRLAPRVVVDPGVRGALVLHSGERVVATWDLQGPSSGSPCLSLEPRDVVSETGPFTLTIERFAGPEGLFGLDALAPISD